MKTATTPGGREFARERLLAAVREGKPHEVVVRLRMLDDADRRACLPVLKQLRENLRQGRPGEFRGQPRLALVVAGAGCQTGAAALVSWLLARDLRGFGPLPVDWILGAMGHRDPQWLTDVAHRLAGHSATAVENHDLIRALLDRSGGPLPDGDEFVRGWVVSQAVGLRMRPDDSLVDRLRADPLTRALVPRLVAVSGVSRELAWTGSDSWTLALPALAGEGVLDRAELLGALIGALVRGGRPAALRPFLEMLRRLAPSDRESKEHLAAWAALAADGPSTVAAYAQEKAGELAATGDLDAARLADVSAAVLCRNEKKLVRTQLGLLDRAMRRNRADVPLLLPVMGTVFGHEDEALAERAVKLVVKQLKHADPACREELAAAAVVLAPALRARLAEVLELPDAVDGEGAEADLLPPPPAPEPLGAPATDPAGIAAEVAALMAGGRSVADFERAVDALVRAAHQDREALAAALTPVLRRQWWAEHPEYVLRHTRIGIAVAAVTGHVGAAEMRLAEQNERHNASLYASVDKVYTARMCEIAWAVIDGLPLPFLLATPDWSDGTLEPATLIDRLAAYATAGRTPAPVDFGQALLRVRTDTITQQDLTAALALRTAEGVRLAEWLARGGLPGRSAERRTGRIASRGHYWAARRDEAPVTRFTLGASTELRRHFPPALAVLGHSYDPFTSGIFWHTGRIEYACAVLPYTPETVAVWRLAGLARDVETDGRLSLGELRALAEAPGSVGPVVHLMLAHALGARHAEDRLGAADALLVLAARGVLDPETLGADLADLIARGTVKITRLTDTLGNAARTGAWGTVWSVLAVVLPQLLASEQQWTGLGGLLTVAADCAERCRPAAGPRGLDAYADRSGGSQAVRQARRLRAALGG
ncbi:DUF6493 family protein [Streptomyces sp. NPDC051940]|uniref:DUF7824 domain-containing protein n=1 Tax=Streptomyces sp. NPDC051940 TaxID=3155675 RepID=UPI003443DE49